MHIRHYNVSVYQPANGEKNNDDNEGRALSAAHEATHVTAEME